MGPTLKLNSGTQFPAEVPLGKAHPGLEAKSGMQFPLEGRSGNGIPLWDREMGRSFPGRPLWETVSHFGAEFWDALSQTSLKGGSASRFETRFWDVVSPSGLSGKVRPILRVDSGTRFPERALWENASHSGRRPNAHITRP